MLWLGSTLLFHLCSVLVIQIHLYSQDNELKAIRITNKIYMCMVANLLVISLLHSFINYGSSGQRTNNCGRRPEKVWKTRRKGEETLCRNKLDWVGLPTSVVIMRRRTVCWGVVSWRASFTRFPANSSKSMDVSHMDCMVESVTRTNTYVFLSWTEYDICFIVQLENINGHKWPAECADLVQTNSIAYFTAQSFWLILPWKEKLYICLFSVK